MTNKMGRGKLICRVGNTALLLEVLGNETYFKLAFIDKEGNITAAEHIDIASAVFLERCLQATINEIFGHNIKEIWDG